MGNSGSLSVLLTLHRGGRFLVVVVAGSAHDSGFNGLCHGQISLLHARRQHGVGINILGSWIHSTGVFLVITTI
jgi:hypothetical protein